MDNDAPQLRLVRLYATLRGRIPRSTWWIANVVLGVMFVASFLVLENIAGRPGTLILYPFLFWSAFVLVAKRCHDRGKSPLWLLLLLIPVLGPLWALVALGMRRGSLGENQYGDDPLEKRIDYLTVR